MPEDPQLHEQLARELDENHADYFGWALACCRWEREEAEDVLQLSYEKVLEGRARFRGESAFRTWLFGVIRMTAREGRRARWLRRLAFEKDLARQPDVPPPSDAPEGLDERRRNTELVEALSELPARQAQVLHLVFYQELTVDQAAGVMGCSVGSARTHYARGKRKLRERIESPFATEGQS